MISNLPNVAFKTPDGRKVLIVLNNSNSIQSFNISYKGLKAATSLVNGAVATYVW
jgi:glucosylceramidase